MNKNDIRNYSFDSADGEPFDFYPTEGETWKWFGRLLFRGPASKTYDVYWPWWKEVHGPEELRTATDFVRITERRPLENEFSFYVLFGGEKLASRRLAMHRWVKLGGAEAHLYSFRPGVFFHYVLKHVHADSDLDMMMDILGCFWNFPKP